MQNTEEIWRLVDAKREAAIELSDRVWGMPELAYTETRSCAEHTAMLREQGFRVTEKVAGIPTAVMGEAGDDVSSILIDLTQRETMNASAGFAHLQMDTRGQGSGWSLGDTPDEAPSQPQVPGVMTRGILDPAVPVERGPRPGVRAGDRSDPVGRRVPRRRAAHR